MSNDPKVTEARVVLPRPVSPKIGISFAQNGQFSDSFCVLHLYGARRNTLASLWTYSNTTPSFT